MTEDISATIRLGVTMSILAVLVTVVLNLIIITGTVWDKSLNSFMASTSTQRASVIRELETHKAITAPLLYRAIYDSNDIILSINIEDVNGRVLYGYDSTGEYGDINDILANSHMRFKVTTKREGLSYYIIDAKEVTY